MVVTSFLSNIPEEQDPLKTKNKNPQKSSISSKFSEDGKSSIKEKKDEEFLKKIVDFERKMFGRDEISKIATDLKKINNKVKTLEWLSGKISEEVEKLPQLIGSVAAEILKRKTISTDQISGKSPTYHK